MGHELGFSGYYGRYTPPSFPGKNLTVLGFDWLSTFGDFDIEFEYIFSHFDGLNQLMNIFANQIGNTQNEALAAGTPNINTGIDFGPSNFASTKQGYLV